MEFIKDLLGRLESLSLWGTIVNSLAVIAGGSIGMLISFIVKHDPFRKKRKVITDTENVKKRTFGDTIMKGLGLCVLMIGINGILKGEKTLVTIVSVAVGGLIGEALDLDRAVNSLGDRIEMATKGRFGKISEGFVTASLLFCVGAMAVIGSLESGLKHDHSTLYAKSVLDFVSSVIFATSFGSGVVLSSVFVFVFHGSLTLLAQWIAPLLTEAIINEMTAAGSLLIIGLGLNMLGNFKIKVMNLLPAVFMPILLCMFM